MSHCSGAHSSTHAKLARLEVLVLDDFLLAPMKDTERRDLLEVPEARYERASTVITSQVSCSGTPESLFGYLRNERSDRAE